MLRKSSLIITFFIISKYLFTQNLVVNPSFEEFFKCPKKLGVIEYSKGWSSPSKATPDYYNTCYPYNKQMGEVRPYYGNGYAGIYMFSNDRKYREYIQGTLKENLNKGEKYQISFFVNLGRNSKFRNNFIQVLFTKEIIKQKTVTILKTDTTELLTLSIFDSNKDWRKVSICFIAKDKYKYFIIGSFTDTQDFELINKKAKYNTSYFYIDNVSIVPINSDKDCNYKPTEPNFEDYLFLSKLNTPIILQNITFETGKSTLKSSSFNELDSLVNLLQRNPTYKIKITGHTDNVGKEEDNLKLSEDRAKAVANYLIEKGILKERITYKGLGSSQPISKEQTEESRSKNRRVEFTIIQ